MYLLGPIVSRVGSVPEFLRKPIATCDIFRGLGEVVTPAPYGSAHTENLWHIEKK